jgi:hypothetical protein
MSTRNRLSNSQIVIMRSLRCRSGGRPVSIESDWQREFVPNLCRRGLIEIWYRQSVGDDLSLRGPFLTLTLSGDRLATALLDRAPRRISGVEHKA